MIKLELTSYQASDRRVYNGALCSDMQKEADHTKRLEKCMKQLDATARCTYFPVEHKFLVFTYPNSEYIPEILTDNFHAYKQEALIEAIRVLSAEGKVKI